MLQRNYDNKSSDTAHNKSNDTIVIDCNYFNSLCLFFNTVKTKEMCIPFSLHVCNYGHNHICNVHNVHRENLGAGSAGRKRSLVITRYGSIASYSL